MAGTRGNGSAPRCILIVDPEEQIQAVLKSALGDAGFATLSAKDPAGARAHLNVSPVALALVELMIQGDGSRLIRELQSRGVPAIAMCGHPEGISRAQSLGCPFLQKPFTLKELFRLIITILPVDKGT